MLDILSDDLIAFVNQLVLGIARPSAGRHAEHLDYDRKNH